jgi:hypothetical protein
VDPWVHPHFPGELPADDHRSRGVQRCWPRHCPPQVLLNTMARWRQSILYGNEGFELWVSKLDWKIVHPESFIDETGN